MTAGLICQVFPDIKYLYASEIVWSIVQSLRMVAKYMKNLQVDCLCIFLRLFKITSTLTRICAQKHELKCFRQKHNKHIKNLRKAIKASSHQFINFQKKFNFCDLRTFLLRHFYFLSI